MTRAERSLPELSGVKLRRHPVEHSVFCSGFLRSFFGKNNCGGDLAEQDSEL